MILGFIGKRVGCNKFSVAVKMSRNVGERFTVIRWVIAQKEIKFSSISHRKRDITHWLYCINQKERVYWAVRTKSSSTVQLNESLRAPFYTCAVRKVTNVCPCWFHAPQQKPSMLMRTVPHFDVFVTLFRTAAEANFDVALFWSMTMHAHIPTGTHRACCMMNSIGTHLTILHTVRTWHHRTSPLLEDEGAPCW